jgi:hypothetical protein
VRSLWEGIRDAEVCFDGWSGSDGERVIAWDNEVTGTMWIGAGLAIGSLNAFFTQPSAGELDEVSR